MQKVNGLLNDPDFSAYIKKNQDCETDRIYCRHDLTHALDVARIAWILNLEEKLGYAKEVVYAAGLLHDIGRWMEYESGISHDAASSTLAEKLLQKHDFSDAESAEIIDAIRAHRHTASSAPLSKLLYRADKLSRNCPSCTAIKTCKNFLKGEVPFLQY